MKKLFVKALINVFGMDKEDAVAVARTVENVFDGKEEVEDMSIDKHVRSLFYELHRERLLKLRREEYKKKGKYIRKYYWSFNYEAIREEAYREHKEDEYRIYHRLPESAWLVHSYTT
ncbi:MAG: hypothetical protein DRN05_02710 [Thermoplasmata archaeon]|nr:MAG: hypothetical protein DRN05_02710 [Thermoplasmata archaeon]